MIAHIRKLAICSQATIKPIKKPTMEPNKGIMESRPEAIPIKKAVA